MGRVDRPTRLTSISAPKGLGFLGNDRSWHSIVKSHYSALHSTRKRFSYKLGTGNENRLLKGLSFLGKHQWLGQRLIVKFSSQPSILE